MDSMSAACLAGHVYQTSLTGSTFGATHPLESCNDSESSIKDTRVQSKKRDSKAVTRQMAITGNTCGQDELLPDLTWAKDIDGNAIWNSRHNLPFV